MKLPCKVVEDILPLYYDGVCSDESVALVEEHLRGCPQCTKFLKELAYEEKEVIDDLKPLRTIQSKWNLSKRRSFIKGVCIALAAVMVVAVIAAGIWYGDYGKYYYQMTENMEKTTEEDRFITSSDYTTQTDEYRFEVWMPIVYSKTGFARVMSGNGVILFVYPQPGGSYLFRFMVTDEDEQSWTVYLKSDLTPDFENHPFPHRSEWEKEHIQQLVAAKKGEIREMLDAVYQFWEIAMP